MIWLLLGLLLFLGSHSLRLLAPAVRDNWRSRLGPNGWRVLFSLVSIAAFIVLIYGFGQARATPTLIWSPPTFMRHLAALLTLPAFILLVAAYVPGNHFKAWIGHPMLAGVKLWALAHLLANGMLHDLLLFGAFLVWAIADFAVSRRRDRSAGVRYPAGQLLPTLISVVVGGGLWAAFALYLHVRWIGVAPFG